MIDHEIVVEWRDIERGKEETNTVGFSAANDVEYDTERFAAIEAARNNTTARQRGRTSWRIYEPGEVEIWIRAKRIPVSP